jgi:CRP/FNR family cyclic AMP-dependent transcriptional regulator
MFRHELSHLPLFEGLNNPQLDLMASLLIQRQFTKDFLIFEQESSADFLYILIQGKVIIQYKPYDGPLLTVATIERGGVFGWSAALQREVYTSNAIAVEDCLVYQMSANDLQQLYESHPESGVIILNRLVSVVAQRLRSAHDQMISILSQQMDSSEVKGKDNENGTK